MKEETAWGGTWGEGEGHFVGVAVVDWELGSCGVHSGRGLGDAPALDSLDADLGILAMGPSPGGEPGTAGFQEHGQLQLGADGGGEAGADLRECGVDIVAADRMNTEGGHEGDGAGRVDGEGDDLGECETWEGVFNSRLGEVPGIVRPGDGGWFAESEDGVGLVVDVEGGGVGVGAPELVLDLRVDGPGGGPDGLEGVAQAVGLWSARVRVDVEGNEDGFGGGVGQGGVERRHLGHVALVAPAHVLLHADEIHGTGERAEGGGAGDQRECGGAPSRTGAGDLQYPVDCGRADDQDAGEGEV